MVLQSGCLKLTKDDNSEILLVHCYSQKKFSFQKTFISSKWDIEYSYKIYQHYQS